MSWPPGSVCIAKSAAPNARHAGPADGGKATSSMPQQICISHRSDGAPPAASEAAVSSAWVRFSARASARRSAMSIGRSQSLYASDLRTSSDARIYLSTSSPALTNEPGAIRPATCRSRGGVPAACRCTASSAAIMPPIDQPTSTSAPPAASTASLSASTRIISPSASSAAATSSALAPSADAPSPGHAVSASAPLPGISTPTTSSHSGAPLAKSANAAVEPPA
mmetsp:Transcript_26424/g.57005  ORF Transcript_26424/g.57005 Transcript_26424/m.57005 type:complete len:224 (+) Transcript_26424:134-805(+)